MIAATLPTLHASHTLASPAIASFHKQTRQIRRNFQFYPHRFEQLPNSCALSKMCTRVFSTTSTRLLALCTHLNRVLASSSELFALKGGVFSKRPSFQRCPQIKQGGSEEAALLPA
ncbi:MAG: hypothetical protein M3P45_04795 [Acidobacteriota bacterium]|nr:hypothetical protein [Acidobacteriota bacterium]